MTFSRWALWAWRKENSSLRSPTTFPLSASIYRNSFVAIACAHHVRQPIATMIDLTADLTLALARGTADAPAILRLPGTLIERSTTKRFR